MLFLVLLVSAVSAGEDLASVLRSPKATLGLYSSFKAEQGLKYGPSEDKMRFRVWLDNTKFAAHVNERKGGFQLGVNMFSAMTEAESRQYLGFNGTRSGLSTPPVAAAPSDIPDTKIWTSENLVTAVKDQKSCGSCWTFGAVGGLETRYAQLTGSVLRSFAEKEYLDCVYEGKKDGCNGGWMHHCYDYSMKNGGRLATTAALPYEPVDSSCDPPADGMIAGKLTGYEKVGETEMANIAAIAEGSITIAFEVTRLTQLYKTGILRDTTCAGVSNHAVTAVGYTPAYILVKNSWGEKWGEEGFVRFARNFHNCNTYLDSYYATFTVTGVAESDPADAAAVYNPSDWSDEEFNKDDVCLDVYSTCTRAHCSNMIMKERYCKATCGTCPDEGSDCPAGTVKCEDGICRHEHMC